jgi:hypothetical protein
MLSPRAQKQGCVELSVLMAYCTRFAKHVAGCLVRQAGVVVQVAVASYRLLEQLRDVLDISWGDSMVGLLLHCRCMYPRG